MRLRAGSARIAASVGLAGLLVAGTAGCGFITPQATTFGYDPSDGVGVAVGELTVQNLLAVVGEGEGFGLTFSATNGSEDEIELGVQYEGETQQVSIPASATELFAQGNLVSFPGEEVQPGAMVPVYLQYGSEEGEEVLVPVVDGTLPEYEALVDSIGQEPTGSSTPTATPTPTPEETAAP